MVQEMLVIAVDVVFQEQKLQCYPQFVQVEDPKDQRLKVLRYLSRIIR